MNIPVISVTFDIFQEFTLFIVVKLEQYAKHCTPLPGYEKSKTSTTLDNVKFTQP